MRIRRTQYEIYWEILSFCKSARTFTQIVNRCDLNSKIGQEHIDFLQAREYLPKSDEGDRALYETTPRGNHYLEFFSKMYQEPYDSTPEFKL